ncbi:hypothetical protein LWP59_16370 [Amycolatopsis acidiphila]|uniref:Uncharacterized protein n=1 Tax=Amycolatopsis acidiphila TaxID=715473 RepID=A0A557ZSH1_9PSEU|nr:hypothetical protein [Amycolatopsis acidiphila]TVT14932.1 hypothetical protein FNH06_36965 [Amycolatopsis acidiphila]UIJ63090.1 hypothetical protein LWP59_16370 [Amycolatopsis acidiphila]GHG66068.1 hypothetical protein GCM10017788_24060 [Amycolatopsis acidiphila]
MKPRVGQLLASTVDGTTVIVVKAPDGDFTVTCGGAAMVDPKAKDAAPAGEPDPAQMDGSQLGKRYADDELGLEVLVTKAGQGTIAVNGTPLPLKDAKPLPASD